MKKPLLFICYFLSIILVNAQTISFQWAKQMGGTNLSGSRSVAVDLSGNVYTTGSFSGTNDFNPGAGVFNLTSFGSSDIFVSKLDVLGNFIWAKQLGGSNGDVGYSIAVDLSGNIYTTGYFNSVADFDPGAGVTNLSSSGNSDMFVSKLDAAGNFVWAKQSGGTGPDAGNSIAIDLLGNSHITGYFNGTVDFDPGAAVNNLTSSGIDDIFISKLDVTGNFIWAKKMGGAQSDNGYSVAVDISSNVYCTGYFRNSASFGPTALTSNGVEDVYISKLDAAGNFMWTRQIGDNSADVGNSIAVSNSGNVYTIGTFQNTTDFDPSGAVFSLNSNGLQDVFVLKLDGSGNFIWAKQIGGVSNEDASALALDPAGSVYLLGNFFGTVDFDPNAGISNLTTVGPQDIFAAKLNSSGNFAWAMQLGGFSSDFGFSITIDTLCNVYTTGYFNSTVDFDPGASAFNLTSAGLDDIFIQKIGQSQCCLPPPSPVNTSTNNSICSGGTASLTATGTGTINWYQTATSTTIISTGSTYITPTLSVGTYTFYAESVIFCAVSNTRTAITLTVNTTPSVSISTSSTSICSGSSSTITASGATTYSWNPASTLNSPTGATVIASPNSTTTYTVTGANGICTSTNTSAINVTPSPTVTVSASSLLICKDSVSVMTATGASTYSWSPSSGLNSASGATVSAGPNSSTNYTVTGNNGGICSNSQSIAIAVSPSADLIASEIIIGQGNSTTIYITGGVTYTWSSTNFLPCTHCASITVSPSVTTTYCADIINSDGCLNSECVTIEVDMLCSDAFVPNVFSPNGDGHNDLLNVRINPNCVVGFDMRIFNRWGEKVFQSDDLNNSWNGIFRGEPSNPAVFVYYLKIYTVNSANTIIKKGNVTLIR